VLPAVDRTRMIQSLILCCVLKITKGKNRCYFLTSHNNILVVDIVNVIGFAAPEPKVMIQGYLISG
jgi:hypothetical protein